MQIIMYKPAFQSFFWDKTLQELRTTFLAHPREHNGFLLEVHAPKEAQFSLEYTCLVLASSGPISQNLHIHSNSVVADIFSITELRVSQN